MRGKLILLNIRGKLLGNKAGHCFTYNNYKDYERDADHREEPSWHHINQSPAPGHRHLSYINCYSAATTILLTKSVRPRKHHQLRHSHPLSTLMAEAAYAFVCRGQSRGAHSNPIWTDGCSSDSTTSPRVCTEEPPLAESSSQLLSAFHLVGGFRWIVVRSARIFCVRVTDRGLDDMVVHCDSTGRVPTYGTGRGMRICTT